MCNVYGSLSEAQIELFLGLDDERTWDPPTWAPVLGPRSEGVFVFQGMQPRVGQWGMIPPGSPERRDHRGSCQTSSNPCGFSPRRTAVP